MRRDFSEKEYREVLGANLTESDVINQKIEEAYDIIRNRSKVSARRKKGLKGLAIGMSGAAAVVVLSITVCMANPALAAKIPFIGNIFETVEGEIGYKGDYSQSAEKLVTPGEIQEDGSIDSPYVQTSNGITMTISECNYESMAMYLAVSIESEEGFDEEMVEEARLQDYSSLYIESTAKADFSDTGYGEIIFDPAHGVAAPYYVEGKFVDNNTFAGIIRVDLLDMQVYDENGSWQQIEKIPDEFSYELHITSIAADPTEGERLAGEWNFALDVKLNHENTIAREVNETNEDGVGIGTVTKTAYELNAELLLPEGESRADYVVAVCDAEGKPLESQGDIAEIYATYQRDVSRVTIYVVDYLTYMDECKGNNYGNLPDRAVFQTEVVFGE